MEIFSYKTVTLLTEGIFTDKGSKFIGYLFPIGSEDDFKQQLKKTKSNHAGARHFCYAYRLGTQTITDRSNDDGEPSGTAGKPILNQLISAGTTQVGLIVVRYFGGTLLGTSGLINAYKSASRQAIENTTIIEKPITNFQNVQISYPKFNDFMSIIKRHGLSYETIESTDNYTLFQIEIPLKIESQLSEELKPLIQS